MASRRRAVAVVGVVALIALGLLLRRYALAMELSRSYAHGGCITPFRDAASLTERVWDSRLSGGVGGGFRLQAACRVGGEASITFDDERLPRVIAPAEFYIYPCDIRLAIHSQRLYVKTQGFGGGVFPETLVYEYDLVQRRVRHSVHVRASWLPGECPVGERRESENAG